MTIENILDMFYENKNCPAFHDALCMAASAFQKQINSYYCEQEAKPHRRQRVRKLTEEEKRACKMALEFDDDNIELKDSMDTLYQYAVEWGLIDKD